MSQKKIYNSIGYDLSLLEIEKKDSDKDKAE